MLGRTDRRLRMVALLVIFSLFGTTAMMRLSYWQVIAAPDLVVKATGMMRAAPATTLARADIVDRNGKTLAQSTTYHRLDAYPVDIPAERRGEIVAGRHSDPGRAARKADTVGQPAFRVHVHLPVY